MKERRNINILHLQNTKITEVYNFKYRKGIGKKRWVTMVTVAQARNQQQTDHYKPL